MLRFSCHFFLALLTFCVPLNPNPPQGSQNHVHHHAHQVTCIRAEDASETSRAEPWEGFLATCVEEEMRLCVALC